MHKKLDQEENRWIEMQQLILNAKTDIKYFLGEKISSGWRRNLYKFVEDPKFDFTIIIFIVLNIFSMGLYYDDSSPKYDFILEVVNYVFTGIFIMEAVLKILAMGIFF